MFLFAEVSFPAQALQVAAIRMAVAEFDRYHVVLARPDSTMVTIEDCDDGRHLCYGFLKTLDAHKVPYDFKYLLWGQPSEQTDHIRFDKRGKRIVYETSIADDALGRFAESVLELIRQGKTQHATAMLEQQCAMTYLRTGNQPRMAA
ncbi:hypothetical protein [Noviherbaspirillum galbum]|uniref:Uncharacterized protein n=1 Tax=Noviherbaspirillum galbum TaxID=2709383 RepID=A0A6B3SSH9_9BURK|nr:hypothetical protein [Noviherbaspirillum galbum]NEX63418.1 hypothetical protein [Noviherbaspirillum galbum]